MVKVYVEGGGDAKSLRTECRQGFSKFFEAAGLKEKMPRIVACGSRNDAFDSYCTAFAKGEAAFLLVDSEDAVDTAHRQETPDKWKPWNHLANRDKWAKPANAVDTDCP